MRFNHRSDRYVSDTQLEVTMSSQPVIQNPIIVAPNPVKASTKGSGVSDKAIINKIKEVKIAEEKLDSHKAMEERLKKFVTLKIL
jgi:hypothetical protein